MLSLKVFWSFFLSSLTVLLVAQEIDSLPGSDSLPVHSLSEVVVTANRYGTLQQRTAEAIRVIRE